MKDLTPSPCECFNDTDLDSINSDFGVEVPEVSINLWLVVVESCSDVDRSDSVIVGQHHEGEDKKRGEPDFKLWDESV
jgi:hypothetical protein